MFIGRNAKAVEIDREKTVGGRENRNRIGGQEPPTAHRKGGGE
jgi:hypothetical protein